MTEEQIAINRLMCGNTAHSCKADYIKTAIKALEKQIAKKVIRKPNVDMTHEEVTCPCCDRYISNYTNKAYCDCGQKLDWE